MPERRNSPAPWFCYSAHVAEVKLLQRQMWSMSSLYAISTPDQVGRRDPDGPLLFFEITDHPTPLPPDIVNALATERATILKIPYKTLDRSA